jgi:hypothetical protein
MRNGWYDLQTGFAQTEIRVDHASLWEALKQGYLLGIHSYPLFRYYMQTWI